MVHPADWSHSREYHGHQVESDDDCPRRMLVAQILSGCSSLRCCYELSSMLVLMGFSVGVCRSSLSSVASTLMSVRSSTASFVTMLAHRVRPYAGQTRSWRRQLVGSWHCIARAPGASLPELLTSFATERTNRHAWQGSFHGFAFVGLRQQ